MIGVGQLTLAEALKQGKAKRKGFEPNDGFKDQLQVYEKAVLKKEAAAIEEYKASCNEGKKT